MQLKLSQVVADSGVQFGTSGARGLVTQMTNAVCYAYAQSFFHAVAKQAQTVVIGHDLRPSSPVITAACAQAAIDAGCHVIFVGAMPTPAIAYYAQTLNAPAIVITGSHIPFDRNGIKFYRNDGEISKDNEQAMLDAVVEVKPDLTLAPLPVIDSAALTAYIDRYTHFFGVASLQGMRIAVYEHSSVARDILRTLLETLGATVLSLGRTDIFVPIDTEAVRDEDVEQARQWAKDYAFDAILSTDGDADRPLIGDEQGNWLRGDVVGILCAQYLQADLVVTPVSCNTALEKSGFFKQILRTRIGSPYVIAGMEVLAASHMAINQASSGHVVVGYEANGGFLLGSDLNRNSKNLPALATRDAVLPILAILSMAREKGCKVSKLPQDLPKRFTASNSLKDIALATSHAFMARCSADLVYAAKLLDPDAGAVTNVDATDGLRVTFANEDIVHLRPSGNAPELRCYAEAASAASAQSLCSACLERLRNNQT